MLSFKFSRWLKTWFRRPRGKTIHNRPRFRLNLEELESRLTPAPIVWQGGAGPNWSVGANWVGGVAPTVGAPVELNFSNSATAFTANNNIAGLTVSQLTIAGNYTLTSSAGVSLNLANPSTNTGHVIVNTSVVATSSMAMFLGGLNPSTEFINVQSGATLTWSGVISGHTTAQLTKQGAGTLILTADNSNFAGPFKIDATQGNGVVSMTNENALGNATSHELQVFSITGATVPTTRFAFRLPDGITNPTTVDIAFTGTAADAGAIQTALQNLFNGLGMTTTLVSVTRVASGPGSATFTMSFADTTGNPLNVLQFQPILSGGAGTPVVTTAVDGGSPNLTTIDTNAQLQINITPGAANIDNPLSLNGGGPNGTSGALFNIDGNNTWSGNVQMNATNGTSNTTFGVLDLADTLTITGQISNAGLSGYTLTKEGVGTVYLNPLNAAGNTFAGNSIVHTGELSIGHPFALGPGGGRTIVNSNSVSSGSLTINYSGNTFIPTQHLYFAEVQTLSFTGAASGTTAFTLGYNGETTAPITLTSDPVADALAIQTALNNLPTILGIQAFVTVVQIGGDFHITFQGSLGGIEIPTINAAIAGGPGVVSVGIVAGTTPIGFHVPNQFLTLNGPGKSGIFVSPRTGPQTGAAPVAEVTGALNNQAGHNSWDQIVTLWSTPTSPLPITGFFSPAVTIGAVRNTNLTINTMITDNGVFFTTPFSFSKVGHGRLILNRPNQFPAFADVLQGALNLRDSNAIGQNAGAVGRVEAWNGTSIELQADGIPDTVGAAGLFNLSFPDVVPIRLNGAGLYSQGARSRCARPRQSASRPIPIHSTSRAKPTTISASSRSTA